MNQRKIILYIACSVDGYIAGPNDNLDFLSMVERPSEDYGYQKFTDTIDAVIMGRKTYDKVLSFGIPFPHSGRNCFVVTKTKTGKTEHVTFWNSDPDILVRELLKQPGKDVFVDGGASLVDALMKHNLIDRYIISTIPVFIGDGIPLFKPGRPAIQLKHLQTNFYPSGLVQTWYDRI
ncbi:MAG: dihydrofolate reductase family protein [Bacteroidia bacterium]